MWLLGDSEETLLEELSLRMCDWGGGGLNCWLELRMFVDSLECVRVKGGESELFRIDSGVRHGCIMSPRLFNM